MKNIFLLIIIISFYSCSQKNNENAAYPDADIAETKYDTTAIDSFSNGAISVDVAAQIRKSSFAYQDSVKLALQKEKEAKLEAEQKTKAENEAKETLNKEKTANKLKLETENITPGNKKDNAQ